MAFTTTRASRAALSQTHRGDYADRVARIYMMPPGPERDAALAELDQKPAKPAALRKQNTRSWDHRLVRRRETP
jgi:hypothetical protein